MKLEACLTLRKVTVKLGLGANHLGLNPPGHIGDIVQAFDLVGMKPNPSHGDVALIPPALGILTLGLLGKRLLLSRSVMSDSLQPRGLRHTRLPCPSLSPRICSNSCPLSR